MTTLRTQIEAYIENLPPRLRRRKRHLVLSVYADDGEYLAGDGVEGDLDEGLAAAESPRAAGAYLNFSDFSQGNFRKDEKRFTEASANVVAIRRAATAGLPCPGRIGKAGSVWHKDDCCRIHEYYVIHGSSLKGGA